MMGSKYVGVSALVLLALAVTSASAAGIGLSSDIQPTGFFQPKYPFNATDIVYPFESELNNSYVCKTGTNIYGTQPTGAYVAVLSLAPCNYITEHYHPEAYEINYIMVGSLDYWIINADGKIFSGTTPKQNTQILPLGLTHVILNNNCNVTTFFHRFAVVNPIFMFTVPSIETMPSAFKKSSFVGGVLPPSIIPDGIHTLDLTCMAKCGLTTADYSAKGQFGNGICNHLDPLFKW